MVDRGRIAAQGTAAELKAHDRRQRAQRAPRRPARRRRGGRRWPTSPPARSRASTPDAGEIRVAVADPAASAEAVRRLDARRLPIAGRRAAAAQPRRRLPHPHRTPGERDRPHPTRRPHDHRHPTVSERAPAHPGETIADSRVMAVRQLRKILRRPTYVVYLFVQPVILVLLFRYVFGGAINTGRVSYVDFLMPGIIVMTAVFGALTTGLGLTEDLGGRRRRPLPLAADRPLGGAGRPHRRRPRDQHADARRHAAARRGRRLPPQPAGLTGRAGGGAGAGLRVRLLVDQRLRRAGRARPRDRPVGRVHLGLPAGVRLVGVRADRLHARRRARVRRRQPGDPGRRRGPRADDRPRRRAGPALGTLAGWPACCWCSCRSSVRAFRHA